VIRREGVAPQTSTDMVVGLFAGAKYRNQSMSMNTGDSLVLFTDGVTEAENEAEDQLGLDPITEMLGTLHGVAATEILQKIEAHVQAFCGNAPSTDDVTMLAFTRL
jgi:sigma-B regulation protein RsbU (phosphoserine phosphatase)